MQEFADRLAQRKRSVQLIVGGVLVAGLAAGLGLWWGLSRAGQAKNPFSEDIKAAATTPLYYPKKLPKSYALDSTSARIARGVVTMTLVGADSKVIYISEQAKPKDFDFNFFYSKVMQVTREVDLPVGTAKIGTTKDRPGVLTVSLVAEPAWILITYPESLKPEEVDRLLRSLARAN